MAKTFYIDADACPVKEEVYRVARRLNWPVFVVSNSWIRTPQEALIKQIVVDAGPDVADDWIAERAGAGDVVITNDFLPEIRGGVHSPQWHRAGREYDWLCTGGPVSGRASALDGR
jgi:hypothetical protein